MPPTPLKLLARASTFTFTHPSSHAPLVPKPVAGRDLELTATRANWGDSACDNSVFECGYSNLIYSLSPGAIAGIILGSVAGLLLLLWLLYTCISLSRHPRRGGSTSQSVIYSQATSRRKSSRRRERSRPEVVRETVEVRRAKSRSPVRVVREEIREERRSRTPERVERVIVEESRRESVHREREPSVSGRGSDEVVVIEEHSPPRRQKSRKSSAVYEEVRRDSGFRTVDPGSLGGVVGGGRRGSSGRR